MEDTGTGWNIQGYRENGRKMNWILEKGLTLGKRILITGVVVSSAPVVLTPLVVISAIGFACSVPYGFFLASYVCTEKLMSKLLPSPMPSPVLIENGMKDGYDDYEEQEEREDTWFGGDISTEEDQEELLEQTNGDVEARFEPIKKDKEEEADFLAEDVRPQKTSEKENVYEIIEENVYGEDLGEFVEEEEERQLKGTEMRTGVRAEENEPLVEASGDRVHKVSAVMFTLEGENDGGNKFKEEEGTFETSMVVELCQGPDNEDEKKLVSETEDTRDDVESENRVKYNEQCVQILHEDAGEEDQKGIGDAKRIEVPLRNRNAGDCVSVKGPIGTIEKKTKENEKENVDVQKIEDIGSLPDKRDVNNILSNGHKREMPEGKTWDQTADAAKQDLPTNIPQEIPISSSSYARAIAYETGFDLPDDTNAACQQHSHAEYGTPEGSKHVNYTVCKVPESSEVIFPLRVDDSIHAVVPSQKDVGMASDLVLYNGEMWKQITALRAIVGYTAAPQKTCVEELRALYIVTGIELPASFKDPCDLVEVNDKLKFLMSVVGVIVEA